MSVCVREGRASGISAAAVNVQNSPCSVAERSVFQDTTPGEGLAAVEAMYNVLAQGDRLPALTRTASPTNPPAAQIPVMPHLTPPTPSDPPSTLPVHLYRYHRGLGQAALTPVSILPSPARTGFNANSWYRFWLRIERGGVRAMCNRAV